MAVITLGTTANNSIANAKRWLPGWNSGISAADLATLSLAIRSDDALQNRQPGSLTESGLLFLPGNRSPGGIQLQPGDYIGVDTQGWPIVVSAYSIANGLWVHG